MIDDDHKGIANLLNLHRPPVRTPKVETQDDPLLSLSESLMRIKPLELPKSERPVVKKEGYQDQYNKYFNKKSDQYYKNQTPKKKIGVLSYVNKMVDMYEGDNINTGVKYTGTRSDNPSWMKDLEKTGPYGKNKTKKDVVTFDPTTQLFTDDTRNIAFKSYDQAKRWNDAVNQEPTATAKQVNDLKGRLDNSRAYGYNPEDKKEDMRKIESVKPKNPHRRLI